MHYNASVGLKHGCLEMQIDQLLELGARKNSAQAPREDDPQKRKLLGPHSQGEKDTY